MTRHWFIAQFLLALPLASTHSRWSCPEPRSSSTGIKTGPCGNEKNDFDNPLQATSGVGGSIVEIKPGPLRVTFEESIHHTGAPFRISLSNDGNDDDSCVLLDHIPHNDCCRPSLYDPTTYTPHAITINIPNVLCERCSLHLANPMTDKIGSNGSPSGIGCSDPGTCFSVYHSCTRPFRIAGDVPRSEFQCPSVESMNEDWPTVWMGDNGENVDAGTPGVYRRESSIWSTEDYTLTTVPVQYREDAGGLCREVTTTSPTIGEEVTTASPTIGLGQSNSPTNNPTKFPPSSPAVVIPARKTSAPMESPGEFNSPSILTTSPTAPYEAFKTTLSQPSSSADQTGFNYLRREYLVVFYIIGTAFI